MMCADARYLIQYIPIYTFPSTGFVMMKIAEVLLLSLNIVQPHDSFMQRAQAVALNCCLRSWQPKQGILNQYCRSNYTNNVFASFSKKLIPCPLSYTAVYYEARFQTNSYNCLSYQTNNFADDGQGRCQSVNWGGGGFIFIYSGSARLVSFEIKLISKEASREEPEYMNIHPPPPPPISVLATALTTGLLRSQKQI